MGTIIGTAPSFMVRSDLARLNGFPSDANTIILGTLVIQALPGFFKVLNYQLLILGI